MIIALDYDRTYTKDRSLWNRFIIDAKTSGHQIICVTMRYDNEDEHIYDLTGFDISIPIYYTGRKSKAPFMQKFDIKIDVWIDDDPMWIFYEADAQ